jgi:hypothetical protein
MSATLDRAAATVAAAAIVEAEFAQLPSMRLTQAQVRRLCHLSGSDCDGALHLLLDGGRLLRDPAGQYARRESASDAWSVRRDGARRA